ncbi:MAG TPA: efflux RND transporter periplasmic adaptor subunit [Anaerolineae bacterium]|nr:efflux RND transporter periplasmic adaptor subunit [Anaerolineae bacterium]
MKRRTWIIIGIVLVATMVVVGAISNRTNAVAQSASSDSQIGQVVRTTLSSAVESSGSITAQEDVALSFRTGGTVAQVNVDAGQRVKTGDVLAKLDTAQLELQVAGAEQSYLLQQATYSQTVQPDPDLVTAAQAGLNNAQTAYQIALQKSSLTGDQITVGCANLDNAQQAYDDATTAYNNYLSDWRVQVYGTYEVSPQKARLDSATAAYELAQANCTLALQGVNDSAVTSAWAQLQQAKENLSSLISPRDEKLTVARAQLEQARLTWEQAQLALTDAEIVAPFDGIVTRVNVQAGGPSGAGPAIELADVAQYHVNVFVDETEISQVEMGQPAEITLDAAPGATLTGKVSAVDPAGVVVQGVVNFNVRIDIDPTDAPIKLAMTTNTRILGESRANVLAVPTNAIRSAADGTLFVIVVDPQGAQRNVTVKTGLTEGKLTEVSGDLKEGEQILINLPIRPASFGPFGGG